MKLSFLYLPLITLATFTASSQRVHVARSQRMPVTGSPQVPVIKASSNNADIKDGLHFRKAYWYIMPEKKPDRYYVELPAKEHAVTFYTDIDSITFNTMYGGVYNFVILLNGKDSCYTQIIASPKTIVKYRTHSNSGIDSIPFTLGSNNKIYIRASLNHTDSLDFQFDLGSTYSIVKSVSVEKARIILDSVRNSEDPISNYNQVDIAGLHWDSIPIHIYDRNMTSREDGLLGNSLFQDKIVEINYDKRLIIVRDNLPEADTTYSVYNMILVDGVVPMMEARLATKDTICKSWFVFDTGDSGNAWIDDSTASRFKLYKGVDKIFSFGDRVIVKLPEMRVANLSFFNISAILAKPGTHTRDLSLLGNSILKRFNVILDNRYGYIYMKPNSLRSAPFDNTLFMIYGTITLIVLFIIALVFIIVRIYRRRKARRLMNDTVAESD